MIHRYVQRDKKKILSEELVWSVLRRALMTEKSTAASAMGQYIFEVESWANKIQIARAVEKIFSVKVASVNTLRVKGKKKVFRGRLGTRPDRKKAIVSLVPGAVLDLEAMGGAS